MKVISIVLSALILLAGCGHDHSTHDHGASCEELVDIPLFQLGSVLTSADGKYSLIIEDIDPNPIDQGNNSWSVVLKDNAGNVVPDAKIVLVPTMPKHGHGTFPALFLAKVGDAAGSYEIGPFDLIMPGTWLMTFTITGSDEAESTVVVSFCIES